MTARHTPASIRATLERRSTRDANGCLLWQGHIDKRTGYGAMAVAGKLTKVHRAAWEVDHGPIPPGMKVCHTCDVRSCIEPSHLWLGTQAENMSDAKAKGRMSGNGGWNAGRPWDEETKAKIKSTSRLRPGKAHSAESRAKMSVARAAWWSTRNPIP